MGRAELAQGSVWPISARFAAPIPVHLHRRMGVVRKLLVGELRAVHASEAD